MYFSKKRKPWGVGRRGWGAGPLMGFFGSPIRLSSQKANLAKGSVLFIFMCPHRFGSEEGQLCRRNNQSLKSQWLTSVASFSCLCSGCTVGDRGPSIRWCSPASWMQAEATEAPPDHSATRRDTGHHSPSLKTIARKWCVTFAPIFIGQSKSHASPKVWENKTSAGTGTRIMGVF